MVSSDNLVSGTEATVLLAGKEARFPTKLGSTGSRRKVKSIN